ncbi:MAG: NADH:flavin oxidoreductase [Armatimonadetes bacterium]|nr:NADH:flavin oxidoreductase [Armatimonadota bacterium]MDW8120820.1 NADH:flavin oxidoreductase [Armatimonadota bacterium]
MPFFHYRSAEQLANEVNRLGLTDQIILDSQVRRLAQPVSVGGRKLWNAFAYHPMEGCDGTTDGRPSALTERRYERLATGGGALIWVEATAVSLEGRANPRQLCINEQTAKDFERLVKRIRQRHKERFGEERILIGLQLTHSGRYCYQDPRPVVGDPVLDRRLPARWSGRYVTDGELEDLTKDFLHAARLAWSVGFDFVDIKQCHRYLLSELLSAKTRPGPYGGDLSHRTRLARQIFLEIWNQIGDQILLASRINVFDGPAFDSSGRPEKYPQPFLYGFGCDPNDPLKVDLTEPIQWIKEMVDLGVQMVNVTMGNPYANPHIGRPFDRPPNDGYPAPEHPLVGVARHFQATAQVKKAVGPQALIVGTGYSFLRQFLWMAAEANLRRERVDIVGVGRGALAYPDFAQDLLNTGAMDVRKVCLAVSFCTTLMRTKDHPLGQAPTGCVPRDRLYAALYDHLHKGKAVKIL